MTGLPALQTKYGIQEGQRPRHIQNNCVTKVLPTFNNVMLLLLVAIQLSNPFNMYNCFNAFTSFAPSNNNT